MKVIYFDLLSAQPINGVQFHGGGEYIKSVFKVLTSNYCDSCELHVLFNNELFIDDWILNMIHESRITVHNVNSTDQIVEVVSKDAGNSSNCCFYTGMIYPYASKRFPDGIMKIGVCHGLRPLEKLYDFEQWRYIHGGHEWKEYVRSILRRKHAQKMLEIKFTNMLDNFDIIITDSQHSKYSIKKFLPGIQKSTDLRVFYPPLKHVDCNETQENSKIDCDGFIMLISANRWLKNAYRGVQAIDALYERRLINIKTRVYGNLPESIRKTINHKDKFEFIEYVSTEELEHAYSRCKLFFYPTLNEGFGLPPMEAMKYGKTCVISSVCSLPEIYGESVYYCNPYDIEEMSNRILMALEIPIDKQVIEEKITRILEKQASDTETLCKLLVD